METKATKDERSVNIQFTRDSKTSVQVDNVREKKFQEHFNFVASRLQKLHKNMMWSMYVGRSFLDNIELVTRAQDEVNIATPDKFMRKDQVDFLHQVKEVKDLSTLSIMSQFIQLLKAGRQQQ